MSKRPGILFPLFQELTALDGIGPKTAMRLGAIDIIRPRDLLFTLPFSGVERCEVNSVSNAILPKNLTLKIKVIAHIPPAVKSRPYKVTVQDDKIIFGLVFFPCQW